MARNWAICIGVNQYDNLPELRYARRDAELMQDYFLNDVKFEKVYLFTDNSPPIEDAGKPFSSKPTYGTLKRFFRNRFENPFLRAGDNLWFFFSGHGLRHADRDYLMPSDADPHPDGVEETAIALNWVTERLRRCGADNVVLLLDACRDEQRSKGLGVGEEKQKGVITIASCSPAERSYEIDEIGQGAFTFALLESLRIQGEGNCATVERLNQRLRYRVGEINRQFRKPRQTPYTIAEPASKYHLILLPREATLQDVAHLKNEALTAEVDGELSLAEALTIRVLAISPADPEALKAFRRIGNKQTGQTTSSQPYRTTSTQNLGQKSDRLHQSDLEIANDRIEYNMQPLIIFIAIVFLAIKGISAMMSRLNPTTLTTVPVEEVNTDPPLDPTEETKPAIDVQPSVDYKQLEYFLKEKLWKDAHDETREIMLKIGDADHNGYLYKKGIFEEIEKFPCSDLRKIDELWVRYSNNHFGFSIQKEIYESLVSTSQSKEAAWNHFVQEVGWKSEEKWLGLHDIFFENAPKGHLPKIGLLDSTGRYVSFKKKLEACEI